MTAVSPQIALSADRLSFATAGVTDAELASPVRSTFVDLARAVAILMMLQGHTLHVVLANDLRTGTVFQGWTFARGLTSCMFLLLSGFVFTVATQRRWIEYLSSPVAIGRRFGRFGLFLVLGYALHFPMAKIAHLYGMNAERWQSFLIVDVLQCIGVMLASLQILVLLARTPGRYLICAVAGCVVIVALTPAIWRIDWARVTPSPIAAYLSPATGSLFPLFPWGAYVLLGAALGTMYVRVGRTGVARVANHLMIGGAASMLVALVCARVPFQPLGETEFWSTSPNQFLLRSGLVLVVLGLLAHISRISGLMSRPPFVIRALAHESLAVYAVHLCIVYGSVWNSGLRQLVGATLTPLSALACVAAVWIAMMILASVCYCCRHRQPVLRQWVLAAVGGLLLGRLL